MKQNKIPRNEYIRKPVGKTDPYTDDVVYGKLGQYTAPGQVTRIPGDAYGTSITMNGVPYPVYGEDNLGYSQMMYPGMDYQFPGQYVTEYPMAAYGGDPSLPALTGHYPFGGMYTKTHTHMQKGGWLDTYDDEYRRGGSYTPHNLKKKSRKYGTSKNIQSSINKIFARNYDLFGSSGKGFYDPKSKYQEGGKTWGEMSDAEKAAYLDSKEKKKPMTKAQADAWANKAERQSREQGKKEYYKDWVAENYYQGAANPAFMTIASFTPWGLPSVLGSSTVGAASNLANKQYLDAAIDASMLLPAGKTVGKGVKKVAEKVKSAVPKKLPKQPVGKMEGLGAAEDIGSKFKIEGPADNPYMYVPNKKDPNLGTWKPMFGYKDWMNHGYTDVPSFNKQIQDLKTLAVFGKRPVPTKVKAKMDPHESITGAIEGLDAARFEEGLTDIIPASFYRGSKPYTGKQAFKTISPNRYGGGWLDEMQDGASVISKLRHKQDMIDAAEAAANFKNSNRASSTVVNKFIPKLTEEDIAVAEANKEFAKLPKAQQDAINMQNQAMYSRRPEAQLSQGKKLTEEEQAYSDKVSRRIKYPFSDIGIAAGNIASYLGRFEGLSPEEIAASTNNPMGALSVSSDVASEAMINEMLGVGSSKLFNKGVQRAYGLHKYPNLPDLGLKPLPNGAHDNAASKSMKDAGLDQQMAQERAAELEALHARAFPFAEGVQQPTVKPFGQSLSAQDKAFKNLQNVDDWYNFENKYKGENIAKAGHFNRGVFEIKGHPKYVAKVEAPFEHQSDNDLVGQAYGHLDFPSLYKDVKSPNVGKVVHQFPHPDDARRRILIMEKVEGKPLKDYSIAQLMRIPDEAFIKLDSEMRDLRNKGLAVDFIGDNIFYNAKDKSFKFIDLSPTPTTFGPTMKEHWANHVIKGVDQSLPKEMTAKNIRRSFMQKLGKSAEKSLEKTAGTYDINKAMMEAYRSRDMDNFMDLRRKLETLKQTLKQSGTRTNWYQEKAAEVFSKRFKDIAMKLKELPVDKKGGAWLDYLD